jgi:hypothetical protein
MTVQVLRTNGDYGDFVAVVVDGERVEPPGNGQIAVRLPPGEVLLTIHDPDYPNWPARTELVERSTYFPAVMMDESDPASGTRWHELRANGTITDEMLADVPEPQEEVFARIKQQKRAALQAWWDNQIRHGVTYAGVTVAIDIVNAQALKNQAIGVRLQVESGQPPATVKVYDKYGIPHELELATYSQAAVAIQSHIDMLQTDWDQRILAWSTATTVEQLESLNW